MKIFYEIGSFSGERLRFPRGALTLSSGNQSAEELGEREWTRLSILGTGRGLGGH